MIVHLFILAVAGKRGDVPGTTHLAQTRRHKSQVALQKKLLIYKATINLSNSCGNTPALQKLSTKSPWYVLNGVMRKENIYKCRHLQGHNPNLLVKELVVL